MCVGHGAVGNYGVVTRVAKMLAAQLQACRKQKNCLKAAMKMPRDMQAGATTAGNSAASAAVVYWQGQATTGVALNWGCAPRLEVELRLQRELADAATQPSSISYEAQQG